MDMLSNTNDLNDMIDDFIHKYGSIFQDVVKTSMRNDIQKIVNEAKKEAREESHQNYSNTPENESSNDDWIFEPTNGRTRSW